ncbi:hypothetical protein WM28_25010 [Burkholderia ubonensis]|nr:hypothetical protein WM28_25010 [Burkholderia ubonensis]
MAGVLSQTIAKLRKPLLHESAWVTSQAQAQMWRVIIVADEEPPVDSRVLLADLDGRGNTLQEKIVGHSSAAGQFQIEPLRGW